MARADAATRNLALRTLALKLRTNVERLQTEIQRGVLAPASKEKLAGDGIEIVASTPAELESFMRADMLKLGNVIKAARIRPD